MTVTGGDRTDPRPGWVPPAELPRPPRPRWVAPVATGAALAAGCAAVALWDPGDGGTAVCWSRSVFGVDCPLCGGLRAANALLRGDWLAAADHNVIVAVGLPIAAVLWAVWLVRSLQDRPFRLPTLPRPALVAVGVALLAFTVVRNLDVDVGWVHWLAADAA
ncbi:DUF2752 domain-containing protein [Dermatobacter hominis]|uniref:DUF2752 domain-containing protein n=1 Tax=Dermatobacter hominis TaxID=2884263 RepID=UPI001D11ABE0|nr:DUF2752 domain-containing protein [Dermatobacter hominis]UDY35450.1 DUF2752 domain-containing protein [Dermatobacter hominis]